jgi:hypothetical protein
MGKLKDTYPTNPFGQRIQENQPDQATSAESDVIKRQIGDVIVSGSRGNEINIKSSTLRNKLQKAVRRLQVVTEMSKDYRKTIEMQRANNNGDKLQR